MKILICMLTVATVIMFSACSGGINGSEAKAHVDGFLDAVEVKDYETAKTYLHPDRPADLESYFNVIASAHGADFSNIEIVRYTDTSSSLYDSDVGGAEYSLDMDVSFGLIMAEMEVEIVKNDNGFGIYNLDIDLD